MGGGMWHIHARMRVHKNVLMMKFEGNRPHGKPWHRWEVKQMGWEGPVGVIQLRTGKTSGLF